MVTGILSKKPQTAAVSRSGVPLRIAFGQGSQTLHRLWFSRGKVLTKQGFFQAALTSFDAALKCQPDHTESWMFRGVVLTHLKRYQPALTSFDRALELSPQHREAWIFRGAVLTYLERQTEATHSYAIALQLQQEHPQPRQDYPMWMPVF
jgi:Flp pilus assembly protein TadD